MQRRPNRVFGYLRVSGSEQGRTGTSLDGQRDAVARWCAYLDYPAPVFFVEVASAGAEKLEQRVELRRLLEAAEAGDLIVVSKVDRWSRDIVWGVQSVRALIARGVAWHSIGENLDASTQQGDSTLGIMAWVADQERARIKERTVGRRRELRDAGLYIEGRVPVGYERHERRLRIVPADAEIVREVYRRSIDGASIGDLCAWLRRAHPERHGWDHKTVQRMLRSRIYLGEVTTTARAWVASHEPIVDRTTWEEAQAALDARRLGGRRHDRVSRTSGWLLRGIAACAECQARMSAAYSRFEVSGGYYACRDRMTGGDCDAPYVPVTPADAAMGRLVLSRLRVLRGELAAPGETVTASDDGVATKRDRLLARRERTVDLAADGAIGRDDMTARLARIDGELAALQAEQAAEGRRAALRTPRRRAEVLGDLATIETAWRRATVEQRREILRRMVRCVRLAADHPPAPVWLAIDEMRRLKAADVNHLFEPPDDGSEGERR